VNDHPTVHDLDEQAAVALAEARSMPPGPTRTEAINRPAPFAQQRVMACFPQHIHSIPTGPILGMRERPHGLAAQPFTWARKARRA
jgi:hypothetical protein